ncbi:MAG: helix-turn-helix domain-containing protein [Clostridia bacterium]|nr:helix-turn-helix domain-containing protein [Clostridia bacterium]
MPEKLIYTPEETATLLGMGMNKVYELLALGAIPAKKLGRKYLIPKHALEQWLNNSPKEAGLDQENILKSET